jgi:hypothetical protein
LRDLISGALSELDPTLTADNQAAGTGDGSGETPLEANDGYETDEVLDLELEIEDEDEATEEVEESEDEEAVEETAGDKHVVKVDGETFEVTLDELKAGYQRQADYTREKQALKKEVEQFEATQAEFSETIQAIQQLDDAWEENPVGVLAQFAANTQNPTQAVALLIKELASANLLDQSFLEAFGVTPDIQRQWAQESEVEQLRAKTTKSETARDRELQQARMELEVQKAVAEYERQIDDIVASEGLNFTVAQRNEFRQQLAKYAAENELTNLKAAYKAFKYEESQTKKALAKKTAERAKQKKAASVSARSGDSEGSPIQDASDLQSVILAAMKDTQANLGSR